MLFYHIFHDFCYLFPYEKQTILKIWAFHIYTCKYWGKISSKFGKDFTNWVIVMESGSWTDDSFGPMPQHPPLTLNQERD